MDDIRKTGTGFAVRKAVSSFVPKAVNFTVRAGRTAVKTVGRAALESGRDPTSRGRRIAFVRRQIRDARNIGKDVRSGSAVHTASAKYVSRKSSGVFRAQYNIIRRFAVRQLTRAAKAIRAASDARVVVKIGIWLTKKAVQLAVSLGVPAVCILLVAVMILSVFGFVNNETTFGGLISMPFEFADIGVNDEYGIRYHPIYHRYILHTGIDFATPHYCNVMAAQSGVVIVSVLSETTGYGNYIILQHDVGGMRFYTLYAHLSQRLVNVGDYVYMGQVIGIEGGSDYDPGHGTSTGHHLHFEYRNSDGISEDPRIYLNYWEHMQ